MIHFDKADAYWLKGYTHLLMALLNMALAYSVRDWRAFHRRDDDCLAVILR